MKINSEFILREIAGEYIIVPTGNTALTFNGLITVNEIGAFLWNCLQQDITVDGLVDKVLKEYDVDEETARADIEEFVDRLARGKVLQN